ncbi:MAG TPA: hypothetical protein VGQ12_00560 [Candidatus Angelobacter sp.]|jgi:hypothetical protein|nr:hypothetical protein [Candidatus Angelobacter sp.]
MKRYFICPKSVWAEDHPVNGMPRHAWMDGSSYVELDADHILVAGDFAKDQHEIHWSDHPEIARLAHPQNEGDLPLAHLHQHPRHGHKQFKKHHWDKLASLCALHGHQLDATHTVWDMHDMLTPHYPGLKLARY